MTDDEEIETLSTPAPGDRFADVLGLLAAVRNGKVTEAALKRLRKLERDIAAGEAKLAALTAKAEQKQAALDARTAELDGRKTALDTRETAFEDQVREAHDHLRAYYSEIRQADRSLRYRVLASADLLHSYNPTLQELPDWPEIQRTIGLPVDPTPEPVAEVSLENTRTDWTGRHTFLADSTLTRTINKATEQ
jgi:hypothetical protein